MKTEFAADLETPVSAFLKLQPLDPVFLLESVEKNEVRGRYSFIGILPQEYLTLDLPSAADSFFNDLQRKVDELPARQNGLLNAGYVGFLSYPLSALLHPKLQIKQPKGVPIAGFVLPRAILIFDHLKNLMYLHSPVDSDLINQVAASLRRPLSAPRSGRSSEPEPNMTASDFCEMVERSRRSIASGDIYQVVLSMQFTGESDADPFQLYRALRMINPSPYMFYLNFQNRFQFFGSSPETMVRARSDHILLRPIAGTRPRGKDLAEDCEMETELLRDEKEKAEHMMLLDLARNDLGRLAEAGSVRVGEFLKVERYSHVMHLVSSVEAKPKRRQTIRDLLAAVFPAGTVTGAPKVRAMQIIDELEPHSRDLYAGSVGYFGPQGILDHCISIRCLQYSGGRYSFCAGAGIVADSVPEREFEEIYNKANAIRMMLKMAGEPL